MAPLEGGLLGIQEFIDRLYQFCLRFTLRIQTYIIESMKNKKSVKEIYLAAVAIFLFEIFLLLVFFRQIRSFFPPAEIEKSSIAGFAQYFGYPFYFEAIVFFAVISSPFLIVFVLTYFNKNA